MENKHIAELLSTATGTEGSLLIPKKIYDTMIEEANKFLIPRSEAAIVIGPAQIPGSSIDLDLESPNTMKVRRVSEGADIPLDQAEYTTTNIKPVKYGVGLRITRELMEDAKWNILERQIKIAGKRFAENENSLVITALDSAANTVSGGAAITVANITRAMQYLEDSDYSPTTLVVGNEVLNDLRNIDTFVEANKMGNRDILQTGFAGTIYGMSVVRVSTNAGMTATSAYVFDRQHAYVIAEKRTLTVENFELPSADMTGAALTHRITTSVLRTSAIAKITTS